MKFFSYIVARDFGFAPNPFNGMCTLATCKPFIRKKASIGDWVFGTGSVALKCPKHLIYAMKVTEKVNFNEYWENIRFASKKPVMNGSLKTMYGDNIYFYNDNQWSQEDSHHSLDNGSINYLNLNKDTGVDAVLISEHFYYLGCNSVVIPEKLVDKICKKGPNFRYAEEKASVSLIAYIESKHATGYHGDPIQFTNFQRYSGK